MSLFSSSTAVVRMICNHKKHFLKYKEPHKYISFVLYFTVPTMKSVFSHNDNTNRNTLLTHYLIRSQTFFVPRLEAPKGRGCFVPCCSLNPQHMPDTWQQLSKYLLSSSTRTIIYEGRGHNLWLSFLLAGREQGSKCNTYLKIMFSVYYLSDPPAPFTCPYK